MLKKVSDTTLILIRDIAIPQTNTTLPITNTNISVIFDWFETEEITLSNAKADGEQINASYFDAVCTAVNDLLITDEEIVDLNDLNRRLGYNTTE